MAKLNGVTTVDMTNGEITKIAYEGEEYAKVGGIAQDGDVLLRTKSEMLEVQIGCFYKAKNKGDSRSSESATHYVNNEGYCVYGNAENFSVFRKVATAPQVSAPFAEMLTAKIRDVGAQVDAIDKRVTTLEAQDSDAPLKAGDYITIDTSEYWADITDGKAYLVEEYSSDGELFFYDDVGDDRTAPIDDGAYTKVPAPIIPKFSEGDRVRALANSQFNDIKAGEIGIIEDLDCGGCNDPYTISVETEVSICYFRPQDLELVTENEAMKRRSDEVRKGDIIRVVNSCCAGGISKGDILEVSGDSTLLSAKVTDRSYRVVAEIVCFAEDRKDVA